MILCFNPYLFHTTLQKWVYITYYLRIVQHFHINYVNKILRYIFSSVLFQAAVSYWDSIALVMNEWVWNIGVVIPVRGNWSTWRETSPNATLSTMGTTQTTNWPGIELRLPVTTGLNHGMARHSSVCFVCLCKQNMFKHFVADNTGIWKMYDYMLCMVLVHSALYSRYTYHSSL